MDQMLTSVCWNNYWLVVIARKCNYFMDNKSWTINHGQVFGNILLSINCSTRALGRNGIFRLKYTLNLYLSIYRYLQYIYWTIWVFNISLPKIFCILILLYITFHAIPVESALSTWVLDNYLKNKPLIKCACNKWGLETITF